MRELEARILQSSHSSRRLRSGLLALGSLILLAQQHSLAWERKAIRSYEVEQRVYQLCDQADAIFDRKDYKQALEILRQATTQDPTGYSPYIHDRMADCYSRMEQYREAIKEAETALKFDPNYSAALYELSWNYFKLEHYDTASQYLKRLLRTSTDQKWTKKAKDFLQDVETYGRVHTALKEIDAAHFDRAKVLLEQAAGYDPSEVSGTVHYNLAWILRQTGKPELAIEEAKKSLQFKPNDKNAMYSLAISCQDLARFDEAISYLEHYKKLETDSKMIQQADEMIDDLKNDKKKLDLSSNNLPDYLDHMVGGWIYVWSQKSLPIKVYVHEGKKVKGYKANYPEYVSRAMNTWCIASGNKLSYKIVENSKDADLEVFWISSPIMLEDNGKKRIKQGVSRPEGDGKYFTHVKVEVDCMHGFSPDKELDPLETASVVMHEIGHSLGLNHSSNVSDVMYVGASSKQSGLPTQRDRNTIARMYKSYPVSKFAPKEQKPETIKYLPPPAFIPPRAPSQEDLSPPVFLPPPIAEENEKLSPPFFKPAPIDPDETIETQGQKKENKSPAPPVFTPPALNTAPGADKSGTSSAKAKQNNAKPDKSNQNKSNQNKSNQMNPLFFEPPPKD